MDSCKIFRIFADVLPQSGNIINNLKQIRYD